MIQTVSSSFESCVRRQISFQKHATMCVNFQKSSLLFHNVVNLHRRLTFYGKISKEELQLFIVFSKFDKNYFLIRIKGKYYIARNWESLHKFIRLLSRKPTFQNFNVNIKVFVFFFQNDDEILVSTKTFT